MLVDIGDVIVYSLTAIKTVIAEASVKKVLLYPDH